MSTPLPPARVLPVSAADYDTLMPPANYDEDSLESNWIPAAPYWNAAPTMLLPPGAPDYPVPIPDGVLLIPTAVLPPAMLDVVISTLPSSIPPPPLLQPITLAPAPPLDNANTEEAAPVAAPPITIPAKTTFEPISIQQCATLEALLALHPQQTRTILDEHDLDAATWKRHLAHWQNLIQARLNQDDASLLATHDDAFVAALEKNRGSILTRDDHAALVASARRGTRTETLRALGIPASAVSVVERVFLRRRATG